MRPPPAEPTATTSRLFADRRGGVDRRLAPRRATLTPASPERRRLVDRRRGPERRSTLDRRGRAARHPSRESPAEHLRNALQLLSHASATSDLDAEGRADLVAALARVLHALRLLERG